MVHFLLALHYTWFVKREKNLELSTRVKVIKGCSVITVTIVFKSTPGKENNFFIR